jgi:hypothetical protein
MIYGQSVLPCLISLQLTSTHKVQFLIQELCIHLEFFEPFFEAAKIGVTDVYRIVSIYMINC